MLCKVRAGNLVVLIKEIENRSGRRELHDGLWSLHCKTSSCGGGGEPGLCGMTSCESTSVLHNGLNGGVGMRGSVSTSCSFPSILFFLCWDEDIRYCDGNLPVYRQSSGRRLERVRWGRLWSQHLDVLYRQWAQGSVRCCSWRPFWCCCWYSWTRGWYTGCLGSL